MIQTALYWKWLIPVFIVILFLSAFISGRIGTPYTENTIRITAPINPNEIAFTANTRIGSEVFQVVRNPWGVASSTGTPFLTLKSMNAIQSERNLQLLDNTIVSMLQDPQEIIRLAELRRDEIERLSIGDVSIPSLYKEYIDEIVQSEIIRSALGSPEKRYQLIATRQVKPSNLATGLIIGLLIDTLIGAVYVFYKEYKEKKV